jgi:outer membrane protein TolC
VTAKSRRGRLIAAAVAGLVIALAAARAGAAESLQQAWAMALARDPALAAATADADAAEAQARAARAGRRPSIEASAGYTRLDAAPALDVAGSAFAFRSPPIFDDDDTVVAGARLSLPLYAGGSLVAAAAAAGESSRAAQAAARQSAADLRLDVATRYVDVLRARRALAAADAAVAGLAAHLADVEVMVERENVAANDLLAARVALANARQQRLRAANAVDLAQAAYNRRLGQPMERVPDLEERFTGLPSEPAGQGLEALIATALGERDELGVLDAQGAALAAQSRAERGRLRPQLSLVAGYDHIETTILDREDFASVGLGLRWTLYDGGQVRQRAVALRRQGDAARLRLEDLRRQVELQVREAWLGVAEADARGLASREAVSQADENLRISRELYGAGLVTHTQVLDAIALRVAAAGNRDDALFDAELARLRLARAIGRL